jgi:ribose transport system ATP-binding protein
LGEITSLADRITVLRNGERVHTGLARDLTTDQMIYWMVGQAIESLYPARTAQAGAAVLDVEGLTSGAIVNGLDMTIRSGEIVGLAGLVGSGASESLLALFGDRRGSGSVTLSGRPGLPRSPLGAVRRGIAYVPEERRTEAIFPGLSVRENIAAASLGLRSTVGVLRKKKERELAHELVRDLGIVATSPEQDIATLSGGNQQKAVVGRWLARGGQLYLVDEPTAGVDVSAKVEIYKQLSALATRGAAVLVVSSDFDELVGLCDRVLVVHDGRTSSEHPHGSISVDELTALAARPTGVETTAHASHGDRDRDGHRDAASESRTRASSPSRARNGSPRKRPWIRQIVLASAMVLVIAALIVGAPGFGTVGSLLDVVRQAGTPALLAAALAIALGGGAFDLSIGAVALFCSTLTAKLTVAGVDPMTTLLLGIVAGAVIGAVNGSLTVALKIPPFVSTLGMLFLLTGITLGINGGLATAIPAESPYLMFGQGYVGWIPVIGLIAALVVGGLWLLWHRTRWGLRLRAVGNDAGTSQMRGVNAAYTKLVALVISGAISGLAGALLSSYSSGATAPDLSLNLLVTALAAAFLGSAMTRSYLFDPATAAISALFVTAIGAGFIANGFSDKWLSGVQGIVLLLAVLLSVIRRRELGQVAIF